jgi:hypothetical protein
MEEIENVCKILRRLLGRPRHKGKNRIKMDLKIGHYNMDWIHFAQDVI